MRKLIVVGNPPYQINDGGGKGSSAKPIYHLFVESVIDNICPDYFSFIIPSRWMVGGKGLDKHRERMMNDRRMKKIVHFGGSFEIFSSVEIAGGVNYFLWDKMHNGLCKFMHGNTCHERYLNQYDIVLQDNNAVSILEKVRSSNKKISDVCKSRNPFGIPSNYSNWVSDACLSQNPFGLRSDFNDWSNYGLKCLSVDKQIHYVAENCVSDKNAIIGKYKVVIGKANNDTNPNTFRVLARPIILKPSEICTETYLVISVFDTKNEADMFATYVVTKFFRFMVLSHKNTQNMSSSTFVFVPDVEDYSAPWTDQELYKKFGLTRQEIAYIESKIKAL